MDRQRHQNIISFIGKQLKYRPLPIDVLADVCLIAYSRSEIIRARNTLIDAFEKNIDYTLPPRTSTTNLRGELFRIFEYLERRPCAVGQERRYVELIEKKALVARLDGMTNVITRLNNRLAEYEDSMPSRTLQLGQCSNVAGTGGRHRLERQNNPLVQPQQMPPIPMLDSEEEEYAHLPSLGQEVREPPIQLMVSTTNENDRVASVRVEVVKPSPAPARSEPRVDAPAAPAPRVQDDSSNDSVEDDLSSLSILSSASSTTTEDDLLPLNILNPGTTAVQTEVQVQQPRPIAPPAQRFEFEGLPEPSQPILIPTPIRLVPDWLSEEESPTSDLVPPCSKRLRRMDRPE